MTLSAISATTNRYNPFSMEAQGILFDPDIAERYADLNFSVDNRGKVRFAIGKRHFPASFLVYPAAEGYVVDHINCNKKDNRRANLRMVTVQQNNWNQFSTGNSSSIYKGVTWNKNNKKWQVDFKTGNTRIRRCSFDSEEDAAHAYDIAARPIHGKHGRYNFPLEGEQSAIKA